MSHNPQFRLPYSEREIKIEGFGGRPPFGGRPGALGPMGPPLNPALARLRFGGGQLLPCPNLKPRLAKANARSLEAKAGATNTRPVAKLDLDTSGVGLGLARWSWPQDSR